MPGIMFWREGDGPLCAGCSERLGDPAASAWKRYAIWRQLFEAQSCAKSSHSARAMALSAVAWSPQ